MEFIEKIIAPEGRNKYGNYAAAGNTYKSVVRTTYAGNNTTTTIEVPDVVVTPVESTSVYAQALQTALTFKGSNISGSSTEIKTAQFQAYNGVNLQNVFIGDILNASGDPITRAVTMPENYGIMYQNNLGIVSSGIPSGLSISTINNGTSAATLAVTANSGLGVDNGILKVPIMVYVGNGTQPEGDDVIAWYNANYILEYGLDDNNNLTSTTIETTNELQQIWLDISWTVRRDPSEIDLYTINLTNDSAMINCDINGNVLPGAMRPTCTIELYKSNTLTSATYYDISYNTVQGVSGLSVNNYTGELTFASGQGGDYFGFIGTSLEIKCRAQIPGSANEWLEKTMSVTKAFPGADGASGASGANAVTRWISLSADAVSFDSAGTPNPSIIYATCWKQVGEDPVEEDTATTIYYGYGNYYPTSAYSNYVAVDRTKSDSYLVFGLRNSQNRYYELETVAFVRDGLPGPSGQTGEQGRQGAAIRGPRKWSDLLQYVCEEDTMRMCNGHGEGEDGQWLDIIIQDMDGTANTIYYCNTSFDLECMEEEEGATWRHCQSAFTSGANYDFVATNVLLANNASIDFLTNNELYLRNSAGTITAGGAGGNGVNFWAGYSSPSTAAPFYVNTQGEMKATKGTFGIFTIGQDDSYRSHDALNAEYVETVNSEPFKMTMTPNQIYMAGYGSTAATDPAQEISITPFRNNEICLPDQDEEWAAIDVRGYDAWSAKTAFHARGKYAETARVANGNTGFISYPSEETETEMWMNLPPCTIPNVVIVPQITATTLATWVALNNFFSSAGTNWKFCGNDLGMRCSVSSYPRIKVVTASDIADSNFRNMPSWMKGHIIFYNNDSHLHDTEWVWSGVAGASADFTQGMLFMRINYNS